MGPIGVQDIATIKYETPVSTLAILINSEIHSYISPFLFTKLLLPLLKKTAQDPENDVRVVNVGSNGHKTIRVDQFKRKADLNGPSSKTVRVVAPCEDSRSPGAGDLHSAGKRILCVISPATRVGDESPGPKMDSSFRMKTRTAVG